MLLVFEGVNGCGKTTYIDTFKQMLDDNKIKSEIITSKVDEPRCKELLSLDRDLTRDELIELALIFYKKQHELSLTFQEDTVYLADRWYWSTLVYTGYKLIKDVSEYSKVYEELEQEFKAITNLDPVLPDISLYIEAIDIDIRLQTRYETSDKLISKYERDKDIHKLEEAYQELIKVRQKHDDTIYYLYNTHLGDMQEVKESIRTEMLPLLEILRNK